MNSPSSRSTLIAVLLAVVLALFPLVPGTSTAAGAARGYWFVAADGGIFSFGDAKFHGSTGDLRLNQPIVGMAQTPTGRGYWFVAADGGIFSFGDAKFFGSTGDLRLNRPIVGMAATPTGQGYWFVASDGGVFNFGDAGFYGSIGGLTQRSAIVSMAATPSGRGYWLVASDGSVASYGDAGFHGSMGGRPLQLPVVGLSPTSTGAGYWLVASDGGIFSYGDANFYGSTGAMSLNQPIVGMAGLGAAAGSSAPPPGPGGGGTSPTSPGGGTTPTTAPPGTTPTTLPPGSNPAVDWGTAGTTNRIERGTTGGGGAYRPWFNSDGRYVVFDTDAKNVLGKNPDGTTIDSNNQRDVFVYDRVDKKYTRVNVASDGTEATGPNSGNGVIESRRATISGDGRFVAFWSDATNLVPGDTNNRQDAFLHDRDADENGIFDEPGGISTVRVSELPNSNGTVTQGNDHSRRPVVSRDGSVVVFESAATNLVAGGGGLLGGGGDTNNAMDVFLWRRADRSLTRVSVTNEGAQGSGGSEAPSVSADGRKIAFHSKAKLVNIDDNSSGDVYLRDLDSKRTILVSVSQAGIIADKDSRSPSISADGRYVSFDTRATNLGPSDGDGKYDIYLKDLSTGAVSRVSVASDGSKPNATTSCNGCDSSISGNGRFVTFWSDATNLDGSDTNGFADTFVHDTQTGTTRRVSRSTTGAQGDGDSYSPALSVDGRFVAFDSKATTLAPGGTSGYDIFVHVL